MVKKHLNKTLDMPKNLIAFNLKTVATVKEKLIKMKPSVM